MRYARGRYSPEGFYRDSFDIDALAKMFLGPLGPDGSRNYRSACFDYKKDKRVELEEKSARDGDILVFDGVFLFTPKLIPHWDVKIFLDVPFYETFRRMKTRDGLDLDEYADSNRRYREGQQLYLDECRPLDIADIVIDNLDFGRPSFKRH